MRTVKLLRRQAPEIEAVRFDGSPQAAREILEWAKGCGNTNWLADALADSMGEPWVVKFHASNTVRIYSEQAFRETFEITESAGGEA